MKICLFDIDGTLIQTGGAGKTAFEITLSSEFGVKAHENDVPFSGRTDRAIVRDFFVLHGIDDSPDSWERFRVAYLQHLPSTLASHEGEVLPGVANLLEFFWSRDDVMMGLLTGNIAAGAAQKLTYYDLFHFFEFGGYGDDHVDRDAVAHAALHAARTQTESDVPAEDVWVIGDTPLDVRCARAIGANVVAVSTGRHSEEELSVEQPDVLLADLADPSPVMAIVDG